MATNKPAYRLSVYAPKIEDATETTVMTPVAGAPHSDSFVVTTLAAVSGAKPYLAPPQGRQGSFDPITKKTTTGNLSISVFDPRNVPGGGNASRWSTAFMGDLLGRPRLKGCKILLEQSLDAGVTWTNYFTGRIRDASVNKPQWLTLDLKDFADDLNRPIFVGLPDTSVSSYASSAALLPVGIPQAWATLDIAPALLGTLAWSIDFGTITIDPTQDPYLGLITKTAREMAIGAMPCIARVRNISNGQTSYFKWVRFEAFYGIVESIIPGDDNQHVRYPSIFITPLDATDARYVAANTAGTGGLAGNVEVRLFVDGPPSKSLPILIDDIHPVHLWADIIDGKFSRRPGMATLPTLGTRDTSVSGPWDTLLSDPSFGTLRYLVDAQINGNDFIEKYILQPCNLAFRLDAEGRVVPIDLRRSASLASSVSLTDADLVSDVDPQWTDSRDGSITALEFSYYTDYAPPKNQLRIDTDIYPDLPPPMVVPTKSSVLVVNDLSTLKDVGEKIIAIDGRGFRVLGAEANSTFGVQLRGDDVKKNMIGIAQDILRPFGSGAVKARATYRVSSNAATVYQGTYATVQHTKLPDPSTNLRGGARLMLCLSRDELDGRISIDWLDCGAGASALAPTITGVTATAGQNNAVDIAVTLNAAGDLVEVWTAVTPTSVAVRPVDSADAWTFAGQLTASGSLRAFPLPRGSRIWVRARSQGSGATLKIPSAWAYPTPGYLDLTAPTAPSTLVSSNLFANRVDLSWTVGDPALVVELYQTTGTVPGTWTDAMRIRVVPAGTTTRRVTDLATTTQYSFGVRARDAAGGVSSMATLTLTTTGTPGTAPRPAGIGVAASGLAP